MESPYGESPWGISAAAVISRGVGRAAGDGRRAVGAGDRVHPPRPQVEVSALFIQPITWTIVRHDGRDHLGVHAAHNMDYRPA